MEFIRVYTGDDDRSHFEAIDGERAAEWSHGVQANHCAVRQMAPGTFMDWHPAPQRQIFAHLGGRLEIELEDGSKHVFGSGSLRLMDDLTGKGHLTRVLGEEPVQMMLVRLPDAN